MNGRPKRKHTIAIINTKISLLPFLLSTVGNRSDIAVARLSTHTNWKENTQMD